MFALPGACMAKKVLLHLSSHIDKRQGLYQAGDTTYETHSYQNSIISKRQNMYRYSTGFKSIEKINATATQPQRNVLKYFAIFKNVAHFINVNEPSQSNRECLFQSSFTCLLPGDPIQDLYIRGTVLVLSKLKK